MQGIQRKDGEISSMFVAVKRMAWRYGQIGLAEPDDLCQAVMLKYLKKKNREETTMGWLYKAVHSAAMDAGRRAGREAKVVWRDNDVDGVRSVCEREDQAGYLLMNGRYIVQDIEIDVMPKLKNMLSKLSNPLRQVLVLYASGYSYLEIADMTRASIGTVRSRLYYARSRAKVLLGDME